MAIEDIAKQAADHRKKVLEDLERIIQNVKDMQLQGCWVSVESIYRDSIGYIMPHAPIDKVLIGHDIKIRWDVP